jgi:cytidine deaminase
MSVTPGVIAGPRSTFMIDRTALIEAATRARDAAYAPYSRFKVGSALLCEDGSIYTGCNVENASYGVTSCAEPVAIFKAVSDGKRDYLAIAIVLDSPEPAAPCGACRQAIYEFGSNIEVIMANIDGKVESMSISELLPRAFGPRSLQP